MDTELEKAIRWLTEDLAAKRYAEVVRDGRGGRLSEGQISAAISEYGRTLVPLPDEAWPLIEVYEQTGNPDRIALDVPLWTEEEGRSDLTLSLRATKLDSGYRVEIDDLHVL